MPTAANKASAANSACMAGTIESAVRRVNLQLSGRADTSSTVPLHRSRARRPLRPPESHGGAQAAPTIHPRLRKAAPRRGGALHLYAPVASYRAAQLSCARLDDHAQPLPQQSTRHGVAGGVEGTHEPSLAAVD